MTRRPNGRKDARSPSPVTGEPSSHVRPFVVTVGKNSIGDPPRPDIVQKFALHSRYLQELSISTGRPGTMEVSGVRSIVLPALRPAFLGGLLFYAVAPLLTLVLSMARGRCPIVCQSPYEGLGVIGLRQLLPRRLRPRVQVEVHGDWKAASRLYGSRARRLVSPLADRAARWSLLRADNVRVVSIYLEDLVRDAGYQGPVNRYNTFSDYGVFLETPLVPLPGVPTATFVGVLERYKAADILLDAWAEVLEKVPQARLVIVGKGTMSAEVADRIRRDAFDGSVELRDPVPQKELVVILDQCWCLVIPSRSEGLGRVAIEAMARGRAVVASEVGGLREVVADRQTGRLVPPEDVGALAGALTDLLNDRDGAGAMGERARSSAVERGPAHEYTQGLLRLQEWLIRG